MTFVCVGFVCVCLHTFICIWTQLCGLCLHVCPCKFGCQWLKLRLHVCLDSGHRNSVLMLGQKLLNSLKHIPIPCKLFNNDYLIMVRSSQQKKKRLEIKYCTLFWDCLSNDDSICNGLHYISSLLTTQKDYSRRNH